MNIKTFTSASFTTLALGAALLFTPVTSTVRADPAPNPCATDVFSPECAKKMAYDVCKAGGGSDETCKPKGEARGPTLGVKATPTTPAVVNLQRRR